MDTGILDQKVHARLIADLPRVAEIANVPQHMITTSGRDYLTDAEIEWLMNFRAYKNRGTGLVLSGVQSIAPDMKMMAIGGALLRNFIDARVVSINVLIDGTENGDALSPTVMLVPNLFTRTMGKALPDWKVQHLYDTLLTRVVASKPTVVYVEDLEGVAQVYGRLFAQHLTQHYKVV